MTERSPAENSPNTEVESKRNSSAETESRESTSTGEPGSEVFVRELVESLPVAVYELDLAGRIRYANAAYASITGYGLDELIGMPAQELMAPGPEREAFPALLERLVAETPPAYAIMAENLNRDGRRINVRVLWDYRRDAEGRVIGFACALRDVSEQVRVERGLRSSEQRFRRMFEQSPWGTVVYSPDGRPLYVNPVQRALMGLSEEEMSLALAQYNVLEDQQLVALGVMPEIEKGFAGEPVSIPAVSYEPRKMEPFLDHDPIWLRGFIYPLRSTGGEISEVVFTFENVTASIEAEDLEKRLQHAQKLESLSVLTGGIAHDFNNLLVAIIGNADLALMDLPADSSVRGAVEDIVSAAMSAADLVRQMLAYSGQSEVEKEMLDVSELVQEITHLLESAVSRKATLSQDLATDLPAVEGDTSQLRQVILNLIINASEALGDDSGTITIRTGMDECDAAYLAGTYLDDGLPGGVYCYIEVVDSGIGMDAATRKRLFEPFFTTKFEGRGLGLASVLGLVRGHGGAISVSSEPGEGASFKVLLPASGDPAEQRVARQGAGEWRGEGEILVVDDEAAVRTVAERMLQRFGFEVVTVGDGHEALDIVRQDPGRFACVLLDLAMPRMDGAECFAELVRLRPDLPVLISSGYGEHEVASHFTDSKPAGFVGKPFDLAELQEALRTVLA